MTLPALIKALIGARFSCMNEAELQLAVAGVLEGAGIGYAREVRLSARDRVDFLVDGGIALELKMKTDAKSLLRQVLRYAEHSRVTHVVVGSTTHHGLSLPELTNGKKAVAVQLRTW